jgi:hypothetical protein
LPRGETLSVLFERREVFGARCCERFDVVEPLAAVITVLRQARWERFDVVEPLAAVLFTKAAARASFMKARVDNVAGPRERRGTRYAPSRRRP